jgi:acetyltransferase-like isoleucine patch superfamily enzyme
MKPDALDLGKRDDRDVALRDEFLLTGRVPLGSLLTRGVSSLLLDPWRMVLQYLPGPVGHKLRQYQFGRSLGGMGRGVVIDPDVEISGARNVYLGDFCYLGRRAHLVAPEGYIRIGRRCHLTSWVLGHGGVEIGDYVGAAGTILSATDSHQGGYRMSGPMVPSEQRQVRKAKVVIGDDAFIGQYSIVMPGVTIGQGAVVGPHSLVVANVKPWTVVMGNPARKIGDREPVRFPLPYEGE